MKIYSVLFFTLLATAQSGFCEVHARRYFENPIVSKTIDGKIQIEFDKGTNTHVEIISKEDGTRLRDQLDKYLDDYTVEKYFPHDLRINNESSFLVMPSTMNYWAKPAVR